MTTAVALTGVLLGAALLLWWGAGPAGRALARARTLRTTVVFIALGAVVAAVVASAVAARLMLLDSDALLTVLVVLAISAAFGALLAIGLSRPLAQDIRRLGDTARRVEDGDLASRTDIMRSDEIGQAARALDDMVARLARAEAERSALEQQRQMLLGSISHDLRTPLAALRAALEALEDGIAADPDRYLRSMQHDVAALTALVDDLFLLTRLESGGLTLTPADVDPAVIVAEAVAALAPTATAKGVAISVRCPQPVTVRADGAAIGRVVRNLMDNALRHAPRGSVVTASLTGPPAAPATDHPGEVVIGIHDEGPGFPEGFRAAAFDSFARADVSRARASGGSGLGLAIARGLVEAHGGRIWIGDGPGGEVCFSLPSCAASARRSPGSPRGSRPSAAWAP
jgi:signal transduction histidine kinase